MQSEVDPSPDYSSMRSSEILPKAHSRRESSGQLCTACDQCYRCKVRCSGNRPTCERCQTNKSACTYSTGKPLGKPKGSKNRFPRRKTAPQLARTTDYNADQNLEPALQTAKRPSDGPLPQPKRTMSTGDYGASLSLVSSFQSPSDNTPEMPSCPANPSQETLAPVSESLIYQDHEVPTVLEQGSLVKLDDGFPSSGLNLEIDDFKWFTSQSEQFLAVTPTAILDVSTNPSSVSGDGTSYSSVQTLHIEPSLAQLDSGPISPPEPYNPIQQPHKQCLCDPLSLGIISELHTLQVNLSPLDTALLAARRGLSTVSSYLTCPNCAHHLSTSPSLFLACVLILQQVFACYISLRMQGSNMLTNNKRANSPLVGSAICIGDFEVQGEESCSVLLDAIVRSEIERGKGVIGTLEQWAEKAGDGKERVAGVLLQSLREEIIGVC